MTSSFSRNLFAGGRADDAELFGTPYGTPLKKLSTNAVPHIWRKDASNHDGDRPDPTRESQGAAGGRLANLASAAGQSSGGSHAAHNATGPYNSGAAYTAAGGAEPTGPAPPPAEAKLTPMSDVSFKLYQTKLRINAHKRHPHHNLDAAPAAATTRKNEPVYYTPPSSIQSGIQEFLPPNFHDSRYNPVNAEKKYWDYGAPGAVRAATAAGKGRDDDDRGHEFEAELALGEGVDSARHPDGARGAAGRHRLPLLNSRMKAYQFVDGVTDLQGENAKLRAAAAAAAAEDANDDADGFAHDGPTGEWFNPVVKEALGRQINKQEEFRKLSYNVLLLVGPRFGVHLLRYVWGLLQGLLWPQNSAYMRYQAVQMAAVAAQAATAKASTAAAAAAAHSGTSGAGGALGAEAHRLEIYTAFAVRALYCFFAFNAAISLYRLVRSQDQCLDLALSNTQREMLGLQVIQDNDEGLSGQFSRRNHRHRHGARAASAADSGGHASSAPLGASTGAASFEKPLYMKASAYPTTSVHSKPNWSAIAAVSASAPTGAGAASALESSIGLSNSKPDAPAFGGPRKIYNPEEIQSISKKFKSKYSIEFDYSDEE